MAALDTQDIVLEGLDPVYSAATATVGDTFPPSFRTFIHVVNDGAAPTDVLIESVRDCSEGSPHNGGGTVAAGGAQMFGPFPFRRFGDGNGQATVICDPETSVTVAVLRAPDPH